MFSNPELRHFHHHVISQWILHFKAPHQRLPRMSEAACLFLSLHCPAWVGICRAVCSRCIVSPVSAEVCQVWIAFGGSSSERMMKCETALRPTGGRCSLRLPDLSLLYTKSIVACWDWATRAWRTLTLSWGCLKF